VDAMANRRKNRPYVERDQWAGIEKKLLGRATGPRYVGVDGASGQTLTATLYHSGGAEEHLLRIEGNRIVTVSVTELACDQTVIDDVLALVEEGPEEMLAASSRLVRKYQEARKHHRNQRDAALAELMMVHGWRKKSDIYRWLGVRIARSDLDEILDATSVTDLPGYPNGEVCAQRAQDWEEEYRKAILAEETASRLRNSLIRGLWFGWYGDYSIGRTAQIAGCPTSRVNQICRPDYPAYRSKLRAARSGV
jgi:hypothetical protein